MIPVILFNANTLSVTVGINAPPTPVYIGGTNLSLRWRPQFVANVVTMNPSGPAAPNVLVPGINTLAITPQGATKPNQTQISLPGSFQWISVQLYVMFETYGTAAWTILNQGQFVTGGPLTG